MRYSGEIIRNSVILRTMKCSPVLESFIKQSHSCKSCSFFCQQYLLVGLMLIQLLLTRTAQQNTVGTLLGHFAFVDMTGHRKDMLLRNFSARCALDLCKTYAVNTKDCTPWRTWLENSTSKKKTKDKKSASAGLPFRMGW